MPNALSYNEEVAKAWRGALRAVAREAAVRSDEAHACWMRAVDVRKERGDRAALSCLSVFGALR